jgi:hypothetical protein
MAQLRSAEQGEEAIGLALQGARRVGIVGCAIRKQQGQPEESSKAAQLAQPALFGTGQFEQGEKGVSVQAGV